MTQLSPPTPAQMRDELWSLVRADLLGPAGGPEEILPAHTSPRDRYLVGMLAPSGQEIAPDALENLWVEGEDDELPDLTVGAARGLFPSSLGLSFCVLDADRSVEVEVHWGQYFRDAERTLENARPERLWRREPRSARLTLPALSTGSLGPVPVSAEFPHILLQGLARKREGVWVVSLFLVNAQTIPKINEQQAWMFQVALTLKGRFAARGSRTDPGKLPPDVWREQQDHRRLYWHIPEYAIGHGTAVVGNAQFLETASLPPSIVSAQSEPDVDDVPGLESLVIGMQALSEVKDGCFGAALDSLAESYENWIAAQAAKVPKELPAELAESAGTALDQARQASRRIREGISLLDQNPQIARAFRFANAAMALQRQRTLIAAQVRRGQKETKNEVPTWRLFQLAFILLNLPSLALTDHPDREGIADLLFFPTGGGKTEAYLGLTAFTLAYRRLSPDPSHRSGVAVLMRYTLRLLTLQQFQRAAVLICACEQLRLKEPKLWGAEPFRLGLWVGSKTTPNKTEDAAEAVKLLKASRGTQRYGNPLQLTHCPWCGCELGPDNLKVESHALGQARTLVFCGDLTGKCPFTERKAPQEGLPVVVVDEEIYRRLPSMLISTIDKFAQMAWNGAVGTLFGRVSGFCPRHGFVAPCIPDETFHIAKGKLPKVRQEERGRLRPPDLIIQDELHLISGPLGTLAGLLEIAIEELCSWDRDGVRVRPKLVASTATIRRSEQQVANLFDRKVKVFPPPGLSARDNFFSRTRQELPGRLYVGVCAPGVRMKTALIRCYLSLLSCAQTLATRYGERADSWMTTVGYFNSLRELGGMRRLTEDQVATRLRRMDRWGMSTRALFPERIEELTSRKGAGDIPKILERLETPVLGGKGGIELLLATNMLSVGVDISRLGMLVVAGQPKSTAEYIQATSRVGRSQDGPGLVMTVFNWARPRDLSHYEKFDYYHQTFYQQVEALSVTPFSARAIDRGLTSVLVSLIRLWSLVFNDNDKAFNISLEDPLVVEVVEAISRRSKGRIPPQLVQERLQDWVARIDKHRASKTRLGYRDQNDGITVGLLQKPEDGDWNLWTVLESLREVEPPTNLILLEPDDV